MDSGYCCKPRFATISRLLQTQVCSNIPNHHLWPESIITSLSSVSDALLSLSQHSRLYLHRLWSGVHSAAARLRAPSPPSAETSGPGELRGGGAQRRGSGGALCGTALRAAGCHGLDGGSGRGGLRGGEHSPGVGSQTGPVPLRDLALPMSTTLLDERPLYRPFTNWHFDRLRLLAQCLPTWSSWGLSTCVDIFTRRVLSLGSRFDTRFSYSGFGQRLATTVLKRHTFRNNRIFIYFLI